MKRIASLLLPLIAVGFAGQVLAQPTTQPATSPVSPSTQPAPAESPTTAAVVAPAAVAPIVVEENTGWQLSLSFPVWIPALDGKLTVGGNTIDADQDTSDSIDFLDERIQGAFVMHFEASKGKFAFFADALYIDLEAEGTLTNAGNQAFLKGFIGEVGAAFALFQTPKRKGPGAFQLDLIGGVRVSALELGVETQLLDITSTETVYDPFVGARLRLGVTDWLSLKARGDVGGFGIEAWEASDMVYNVDAGLEIHLAKWFDVGVGYRWLNYDFLSESGRTGLDATLSGPYVELKFNF